MKLSTPKNTQAEVLFELIKKGSVSIKEFSWMEGFRTRVSELALNHSIPLLKTTETGINKHGNSFHYRRHSLPLDKVEFALGVYDKINNH
jgi:hypothetical protein